METLSLLDCIYSVVKYFKKSFALLLFVFVVLHFDLVLILKISVALFFAVDLLLYFGLFLYYLVLLEQVLPVLAYL